MTLARPAGALCGRLNQQNGKLKQRSGRSGDDPAMSPEHASGKLVQSSTGRGNPAPPEDFPVPSLTEACMPKLIGNLRITAKPAVEGAKAHFEVVFLPYVGRLNTKPARAASYDDLVSLLLDLKVGEDDATRYAGKARAQGVILIDSFERQDALLREKGLLA